MPRGLKQKLRESTTTGTRVPIATFLSFCYNQIRSREKMQYEYSRIKAVRYIHRCTCSLVEHDLKKRVTMKTKQARQTEFIDSVAATWCVSGKPWRTYHQTHTHTRPKAGQKGVSGEPAGTPAFGEFTWHARLFSIK